MTDLPDKVRIGPFDYKVLRPKKIDGGDSWGLFSAARSEISVVSKVPTKHHEREIFMHELMHGLWYHAGLGKKCEEERAVRQLSESFMAFVRNNPWFLDWLKDA